MNSFRRVLATLPPALLCLAAAMPARAQLVSRFEVRETVISPDGDGRQDSTRVRYTLTDAAVSVSLVVFAADSVTPVDTLRAPAPGAAGVVDSYWKGRRWDGAAAGEGAYVVTLRVTPSSGPAIGMSLPLFLDLTAPTVQILSAIPDPYAPGTQGPVSLSISHLIGNTSPVLPGRPPDELKLELFNPSGKAIADSLLDLVTTPPYQGGSGAYVTTWDARALTPTLLDGEYEIALSVLDAAGYTARSVYHFELDSKDPVFHFISPIDRARISSVPDSVRAAAFDKRGIDSLYVRYPQSAYQRVTQTSERNDSTFFAVPLADSLLAEGRYALSFRAVDRAGRAGVFAYEITYDATAPAAPVLDGFSGSWHADHFPLSGTVDNGGDGTAIVRIVRNGAPVDSLVSGLLTPPANHFSVSVPVVPGRNEFVAYQRDGAGNLSPPSNRVVVTFKSSAGLFIAAPFVPGGSFQLIGARTAAAATLRVFDVAGDLVTRFEDGSPRQFYAFEWSGKNSSGASVRRGPLVAVATIEYDDGTRDIFREVFLFNPDAQ
ncbi:MAG TPA: hypothetical protein VFX92_04520 [Candidatus Krumholzibacteria bacterium]|nr:hypothetical protein [Candidatus Krumholzibacteria bacterium]